MTRPHDERPRVSFGTFLCFILLLSPMLTGSSCSTPEGPTLDLKPPSLDLMMPINFVALLRALTNKVGSSLLSGCSACEMELTLLQDSSPLAIALALEPPPETVTEMQLLHMFFAAGLELCPFRSLLNCLADHPKRFAMPVVALCILPLKIFLLPERLDGIADSPAEESRLWPHDHRARAYEPCCPIGIFVDISNPDSVTTTIPGYSRLFHFVLILSIASVLSFGPKRTKRKHEKPKKVENIESRKKKEPLWTSTVHHNVCLC